MGTRVQEMCQSGSEALLLTSGKTARRKSFIWNPAVVAILRHMTGCGSRALVDAKFEGNALLTPGSPAVK